MSDPDPNTFKDVSVDFLCAWLQDIPRGVLSVTKLGDIASEIKTRQSLGLKQKQHVVRAIAQEIDSLALRLDELHKASAAAEVRRESAKASAGLKRSRILADIADPPNVREFPESKTRRTGVRGDSMERRTAIHAVLESSYEADYQDYRESMPASASAGKAEADLRANFMKDNARRIAKKATLKGLPGPALQLPDESESLPDSDNEAPDVTDLDNAIRDWDMRSFRLAEEAVKECLP